MAKLKKASDRQDGRQEAFKAETRAKAGINVIAAMVPTHAEHVYDPSDLMYNRFLEYRVKIRGEKGEWRRIRKRKRNKGKGENLRVHLCGGGGMERWRDGEMEGGKRVRARVRH